MKKAIIAIALLGLTGCNYQFTPCLTPQPGWDYKGAMTQEWVDENGEIKGYSFEEDECVVPPWAHQAREMI